MLKFFSFLTGCVKWLFDPKNRNLLIFITIGILVMLLFRQCNKIGELKDQVALKEMEIKRVENNRKAELDTILQRYDAKTGTLTAEIRAYDITLKEISGKYSELFKGVKDLKTMVKNYKPTSITENNFSVTEKITGVETTSSYIDSMGKGEISFSTDTSFSEGNSRKISGKIPYVMSFFNKKDTTLLNYHSQPFFTKLKSGISSIDFEQQMTVYTGIVKDRKTGDFKVWAKTNYPGVTFNVLKGANVQDDEETKKAIKSARKTWGIGFSAGFGGIYRNNSIVPGIFMGVGLQYTPKKLQF